MQSNRTLSNSEQSETISRDISVSIQIYNILIKLFKSAQNFMDEHQLEGLVKIITKLENKQQNSIKTVQNVLFLFISQIQILKQCRTLSIRQNDYEILEQSLQKAESEVRKHIRIQQQLKLYLDGLQEKNDNLAKQLIIEQTKYNQLFQSMKAIHQQKKQLERKLKRTEDKSKGLLEKEKTKGYKSTKLLSESLNRADIHSISMHKSKPTLLNNYYLRTKGEKNIQRNNEKSFQKQSCLPHRKTNKFKALNDHIDVNLSKNTYQQSRQTIQDKQLNHEHFIPTEQDIRIFKQMTRTVQMKEAYKKPVRRLTKYKTETKQSKQSKACKQIKDENQYKSILGTESNQFRSVSLYK